MPYKYKDAAKKSCKKYRFLHRKKLLKEKREYYLKNKKECNKRTRNWYLKNKEKAQKYARQYRKKHFKKLEKYRKEYRQKNYKKIREIEKAYRIKHKNKFRICKIKCQLKISHQEAERLYYKRLNGVCEICNKRETAKGPQGKIRNLAIDHNHKTKKVRGILCGQCNTGLGGFRDNIKLLKKAIIYLQRKV